MTITLSGWQTIGLIAYLVIAALWFWVNIYAWLDGRDDPNVGLDWRRRQARGALAAPLWPLLMVAGIIWWVFSLVGRIGMVFGDLMVDATRSKDD